MSGFLSTHKSLNELYSELCIELRGMQVSEESGTAICQWCKKPKLNHLPDQRCSTYALSQTFIPVWIEEKRKINKSLSLIEELKAI